MIAKIAPLAVLAAISPATLTAVVLILTGSKPIRLLLALYAGGMLASVAIGYAIFAGLNGGHAFTGSGSRHRSPAIDLGAGVLALLLAGWLISDAEDRRRQRRAARHAGRPRRDPWSQRLLSRGSTPLIFAVGVALNLPSGLYLIAVKDVAASRPSDAGALTALIGFNLLMLIPIELPLLASLRDQQRTLARLQAANRWLGRHGRQLVTGVALVAGVYLVLRGSLAL
jgi:hypothetical protein